MLLIATIENLIVFPCLLSNAVRTDHILKTSCLNCSHFQKYLVIMHDALRKIIEVIFEHSIAFTLVFRP